MAPDPLALLEEPTLAGVAERLVAEAQTTAGAPAALYVGDLDGRSLRRVTGDRGLPEQLESGQLIGPEIPADQDAAVLARALPEGATALPLTLRGRALSVLVFSAPPAGDLEALVARGAAALEWAERYTDVLAAARRHRACSAAAELQQDLMPPRIARLDGAEVACSILPAYDVGGDWIDHCAMADGGWLAVADAVGKGPQASAIGAIALGAYRATRRGGGDLADAAARIHDALCSLEVPDIFMSAVLASWDGPSSTLTWLRCGHPAPAVWHAERGLRELEGGDGPVLGLDRLDPPTQTASTRIAPGELVVLVSDGVLERSAPGGEVFGQGGLRRALEAMAEPSAIAAASAILEAVATTSDGPLRDDASVVVLAAL
ncbi:MAG TPA: PP2C family protein-serine/threonine phosphatase [Solirubrobacteraceae bacterium]